MGEDVSVQVALDGGEVISISERTTLKRPQHQEGVVTVRHRWGRQAMFLLSAETRTGESDLPASACIVEPPVELLRFPVRPRAGHAQAWKCRGGGAETQQETVVEVVGSEQVSDAGGRTWITWHVVHVDTHRTPYFRVAGRIDLWLAPSIGLSVRERRQTRHMDGSGRVTGREDYTILYVE
ncbi:MAG: hypothetical protein HY814_07875 [Candidatus Riflebacteria bacterium]|nr:hypothetical protein [Candidatus Riflebacteria bacterium]